MTTAPTEYWRANSAGHYLADAMMQAIALFDDEPRRADALREAEKELRKAAGCLGLEVLDPVTANANAEPNPVTLQRARDRWNTFFTALDAFQGGTATISEIRVRFTKLFPADAALLSKRAPELRLDRAAAALAAE